MKISRNQSVILLGLHENVDADWEKAKIVFFSLNVGIYFFLVWNGFSTIFELSFLLSCLSFLFICLFVYSSFLLSVKFCLCGMHCHFCTVCLFDFLLPQISIQNRASSFCLSFRSNNSRIKKNLKMPAHTHTHTNKHRGT